MFHKNDLFHTGIGFDLRFQEVESFQFLFDGLTAAHASAQRRSHARNA